ncbi:thymidine phosphorylase [bacterium]|nr:MAG: thymidine phosphorylase [bacterium]RKZ16659.1 MAG: thymidine phosphorylase [bacterium]
MSTPLEWIEAKKRGREHSQRDLQAFVAAVTSGSLPDYQLAAWLMATWHAGLSASEILALTRAMRDSGTVLRHTDDLEPTADKHSTGGVGDKASLVIAPLAAGLGLRVPMISGRGLGHTGGTLDKLQSIEGYRVDLGAEEFTQILREVGCSIIGQTDDIAPADRRLYAMRDVTATVDCIGLIVSSILSKKLAAGPRNLVIDLKCGSGAFMADRAAARELARALIDTGSAAGLNISALLTDMDQPLGCAIGNATEVIEALQCLRGEGPADLRELCIELTAEMARLAGLGDSDALRARCAAGLDDGSAEQVFMRMAVAHGAVADFEARLRVAQEQAPAVADRDAVVHSMQVDEIGRAVIDLGGGRLRHEDSIDASAGLQCLVRIGDVVRAGQPLFTIHCDDVARADRARARISAAIVLAADAPAAGPVVLERLGA